MKKKFKISLIVSLVIIFGCFSNVFAATNQSNKVRKIAEFKKSARLLDSTTTDDGGVVGTSNLNGTADNSAKIGDQLTAPEVGWTRYDDSNPNISYIGHGWGTQSESGYYKSAKHLSEYKGDSYRFNFTGNKIRIISKKIYAAGGSSDVSVKIDGSIAGEASQNSNSDVCQVILYENTRLGQGEHSIEIINNTSNYITADAIDIDQNGNLKPYNEVISSITLNKITDSLTVGQSDTLIATVTPDNATNKTVTWTSSDPSIATVDSNGKVTAVKAGTATITATTTDGSNLSASCVVTVAEPSNNRATLTINMVNGSSKQYDLSASELNDFLSWYNGMTNPLSSQCYIFNNPITGPYLDNKDYIPFNKIDDFKVQEYTK